MTVLPACPQCGLASTAIRCPRCNTLKVIGCSGACTLCRDHCESDVCVPAGPGARDAAPQGSPATDSE